MKKNLLKLPPLLTKSLFVVCMALGLFSSQTNAQCPIAPTPDFTYCYDSNEVDVIAFEACPDAGQTLTLTILAGDFEATYDDLTVYQGASGSGLGGNVVFGPVDGDLTGSVISSSVADECLTFVSNSDGSISCVSGSRPSLDVTIGTVDLSTDFSYCYDSNLTDEVAFEICPDAGQIAGALFCGGSFEDTYDFLTVYEGAAGSGTAGAIVLGPIDGELSGTSIEGTAADNCLIFVINSDSSVSCASGAEDGFAVQRLNIAPPVVVCGGTFEDSNANGGDYANDENITTVLCPENEGDVVTATFDSFDVEESNFIAGVCFDILSVYDGDSDASPLIGDFCGNADSNIPGPFTSTSPTGCLTFVFASDGVTTGSGWSATTTCSPLVEPPAECNTSVVTCNDNVQLSLDQTCSIDITPDMILEGGCDDIYYSVEIFDEAGIALGNTITGDQVGQTVSVHVTHLESGNYCWGTISVEDKLAPTIECPCPAETDGVTTIMGELDDTDPTFHRPDNSFDPGEECNLEDDNAADAVYYETFTFYVDTDGMYTFMANASNDAWAALYQGSFDPANGCANLLDQDDDSAGGLDPELMIQLDMTVGTYVLVTSTYANGSTGTYEWAFDGPGNILKRNTECTFLCLDLDRILSGDIDAGVPVTSDNCGEPTVTFSDATSDNGCGGINITRTWTATDAFGNAASCDQDIFLRSVALSDITKVGQITLSCDQVDGIDPASLLDAGVEGAYPYVESFGENYILDNSVCNVGATFVDASPIELCGGGYKVVRNWTIFDWCTAEAEVFAQIIKVEDTDAPTNIVCPTYGTIAASNSSTECQGIIIVQDIASYSENCSDVGIVDITLTMENGDVSTVSVGDQVIAPVGSHTFTYTVTDGCGNTSLPCSTVATVEDTSPPVTICDEHTVAALGSDGTAQVCWDTFDDGTYDNCGPLVIKVKRMDADASDEFTDCVVFDCADIQYDADGNPIPVMVRMRAWDLSPDAGYPDNNEGRWNECMIEVEVQDKLDPIISCPPDKEIDCFADYSDLDGIILDDDGVVDANPEFPPVYFNDEFMGYYAGASDNCTATVTVTESGSPDNCGEGTIFRRWTVTDAGGRTDRCTQRIRLMNEDPFTGNDITWPLDATVMCGAGGIGTDPDDLDVDFDYPDYADEACEQIAETYEDQFLPVNDSACYKILRTWHVIDWCQFDVNNDGSQDGSWTHTQIIKVYDTNAPVITSSCNDITECSYDDECGAQVSLVLEATDECADDLNISYVIDANDDNVPEGGSQFSGNTNDASGYYPSGTHRIYWTVEDGCGNITECDYTFKVEDCKKPTPVCINGLATVVMPSTLEITLWATDFDAPDGSGSFDNCTAQEDLRFRIRKVDDNPTTLTSVNQVLNLGTNVTFDCDDIGFPNVELYVVDENNNWDYCTTYAVIQDNSGFCPNAEMAAIQGDIETEMNDKVELVDVNVAGGPSSVPAFLTDANGNYDFNVVMHNNYTITPEKDINYLNGVTTFDLALINKHILGLDLLDSPYKIIAADANGSNSVTTLDMVEFRKLILNITTDLPGNTSWRFVERSFVFPNPLDPFQTTFPEAISYNNLSTNELNADFVGVKIGDVNNSVIANAFMEAEDRGADNDLVIAIDEMDLTAGQEYNIDFKATDFKDVFGYQFTLNFDESLVEIVDVVGGDLSNLAADNFGLSLLNNSVITTSWNEAQAVSLDKDAVIFTVTVKAIAATNVSEVFTINSKYTIAEAYSTTEQMGVALAFNTENGNVLVAEPFELYQNQPNPFNNSTVISFNLPEAGIATLSVYDVTGKVIKMNTAQYAKGFNQVQIMRDELSVGGMLYYQLETANNTATRKMIIVD